jgi:hypothetical protein
MLRVYMKLARRVLTKNKQFFLINISNLRTNENNKSYRDLAINNQKKQDYETIF